MDSRLFTSEIIEKNLPACCLLPSSIGGSSSNWTSLHLVTNKFNSSLSGAAPTAAGLQTAEPPGNTS